MDYTIFLEPRSHPKGVHSKKRNGLCNLLGSNFGPPARFFSLTGHAALGPALKLPMDSLPTGRQPSVLFHHWFSLGFACSCFCGNLQDICFRCLSRYEIWLSPGRTDPSASHTDRPRPAQPHPCALPRLNPPVVCPGFRLDRKF